MTKFYRYCETIRTKNTLEVPAPASQNFYSPLTHGLPMIMYGRYVTFAFSFFQLVQSHPCMETH